VYPVEQNRGLPGEPWMWMSTILTWGALAGAAWDSRIYVLNGDGQGGGMSLQIYDTVDDSWSAGSGLNVRHEAAAAAALDGKVYFFGGSEDTWSPEALLVRDTVNTYDTAIDVWSLAVPLPSPRFYSTVQVIGGELHVLGGFEDASGGPAISEHLVFSP
jgi:N-acetylneuraminic acid mutarotase